MVLGSSILNSLEMVGAAKNNSNSNSMVNWKTVLTSGCRHQKRYLSKRLFVSLVVYSTHAATDTSATKDESWVENGDGHETYQTSVPFMDDLISGLS